MSQIKFTKVELVTRRKKTRSGVTILLFLP